VQTGQRIWKDCKECLGAGVMHQRPHFAYPEAGQSDNSEEVDCYYCDGLGVKPWGWLRDEKEETMPGEEA